MALKQNAKYAHIAWERLDHTYDRIPGVLLLGDAFSKCEPSLVFDINVVLNDVEFWQRSLCDICDLGMR